MDKRLMLKIIFIYTIINYICFQIPNYEFGDYTRFLLFCIAGISAGIYVLNHNKGSLTDKNFILRTSVLFFLLFLYYIHNTETSIMILYSRIHTFFGGIGGDDWSRQPWFIHFIIYCFVETYTLFYYFVSYVLYKFTILIFSKHKKVI